MMDSAEHYSGNMSTQRKDAHRLLDCVLDNISWTDSDIVLDIGCGSGDSARDILLPRIPKLKRLIAIDVLPGMIDFAKSNRSHPKIEYHVADVENWLTLRRWSGKISKIFSVHCLHWLKDYKQAFENVFRLLTPEGEAAFVFALTSSIWDCHAPLARNPKWAKYLNDIDQLVPVCYCLKLNGNHYRKVLEAIGFVVVACVEENRTYTYSNDHDCKMAIKAICCLYHHIPEDKREEFLNDHFDELISLCGRGMDEKPIRRNTCLTIHVKKVDYNSSK